ncbi:MAG: hypothetical protein LBR71_01145, partial [Synergistaceae bacterium]|nr:hypothetical protein [Synergistaceae bacterium]
MDNLTEEMDSVIGELEAFASLDAKQQERETENGARLLFQSWRETENRDFRTVAAYAMKFSPGVFESFCGSYVEQCDLPELENFSDALAANENFKKNADTLAALRGFILFSALCRYSGASELAQKFLKNVLAIAGKKGKFSKAAGRYFKDYVWNLRGRAVLDLDYSSWSDADKQRMLTCLTFASESGEAIDISEWMRKYNVSMKEASKTPAQNKAESAAKEILQMLLRAREEASSLVAALSQTNGTLRNLREAIDARDAEKRELASKLREKDDLLDARDRKLEEKDKRIEELNAKADDLGE